MNIREHLLTTFSEEAAEIVQDVSKSLRFGLEDRNILNPTGPTNRERLLIEINQFMAMIDMLIIEGVLPANWADPKVRLEKIQKVRHYMNYAISIGALTADSGNLWVKGDFDKTKLVYNPCAP